MEEIDYKKVSAIIFEEVTEDNSEIRHNFLKHFDSQVSEFIKGMALAYMNWKEFDSHIGSDVKKAHISSLIYSAINNHVVSMKMLISGYIVASGSLQRQVIELIALALLCSSSKLNVLDRYMNDKYSSNKAVCDVLRHYEKLNLIKDALQVLEQSYNFYHKYSHPTHLGLASLISFSEKGEVYLGASFDEGKIKEYTKEANSRASLANIFDNIIDGIKANIRKW